MSLFLADIYLRNCTCTIPHIFFAEISLNLPPLDVFIRYTFVNNHTEEIDSFCEFCALKCRVFLLISSSVILDLHRNGIFIWKERLTKQNFDI